MKRKIVGMLVIIMVFSMAASSAMAFNPPGHEKKGTLPYGILKRFMNIDYNRSYQTEIKELDAANRRITIQDGTALLSLLVAKDAKIKLDSKGIELKDLKVSDKVYLKLDRQNTITEIKVLQESRKVVEEITGTIKSIDKKGRGLYLQVAGSTKLREIRLENNTVIKINGEVRAFDSLAVNMAAKVRIEDKKVVGVEVTTTENTKVAGVIHSLDSSNKTIVVEKGNEYQLYYVKNDSKIYIDNQLKSFNGLTADMAVELYVNGMDIKTLYATSTAITEIKAVIKSVNTSTKEIILTYGNMEELYTLASNAVIKIEGTTKSISDLKADMNVDVKVKNGQIIELAVNNLLTTVEGQLVAKDMDKYTIKLKAGNEIKTYNVSSDFQLSAVPVGMQAVVYIMDGVVVAIGSK